MANKTVAEKKYEFVRRLKLVIDANSRALTSGNMRDGGS